MRTPDSGPTAGTAGNPTGGPANGPTNGSTNGPAGSGTEPLSQDALVHRLLSTPAHWAVVGLSTNTARPAYDVAAYLQRLGHTITPVHPAAGTVHGATGYARLADVPGPVDVVDLFVGSAHVAAVVDEAIAVGARALWFQLGVHDAAAEQRARDAGLDVVLDACPKIEGSRRGLGGGH